MTNKQLLTDALCMYLPHNLNVEFELVEGSELPLPNYQYEGVIELNSFLMAYLGTEVKYIKPILRPLYLFHGDKIGREIMDELDCSLKEVHQIWQLYDGEIKVDDLKYSTVKVMLRNHIDFLGLIEKGIAIENYKIIKDE